MKVHLRLVPILVTLSGLMTGAQAPTSASAQAVRTTGAEHIGMNVPDAGKAAQFFHDIFGFVQVTDLGPYQLTEEQKAAFHVHSSASIPHIVMLRAGDGPNIELFEYKSPEASTRQPFGDDLGASHIAFYTDDVYASAAALRAKGVKILIEPIVNRSGPTAGETWLYFQTPWGSSIELVSYPQGEAYEKQKGAIPLWHPHRTESESQASSGQTSLQKTAGPLN